MGILKDRYLRATDVRYLNDSQELVYAIDLATTYLKEQSLKSGDDKRQAFAEYTLNYLNAKDNIVAILTTPSFVASFSEEDDLLSQWLGYCPSGNGFSICFSFDRISQLTKAHGWHLEKCIYKEDEQNTLLKQSEQDAMTNPMSLQGIESTPSDELWRSAMTFVNWLVRHGLKLKHPKFEQENEWRAFYTDIAIDIPNAAAISIREGKSSLVPYIGFPLTLSVSEVMQIESLVISPTPDKELAKTAARYLLNSKRVYSVDIKPSQIPYRHW